MEKEFIKKTIEIFNTFEKWSAFVDMAYHKEAMKAEMNRNLRNLMINYFNKTKYPGWEFKIYENWNSWFYVEEVGTEIRFNFLDGRFMFWINQGIYNSDKVNNLLKTDRFSQIKMSMKNVQLQHHNEKFDEKFEWNFEGAYNIEHLAWFAKYEPDNFLNQIVEKVEKICTNPIKELIIELHKTKK